MVVSLLTKGGSKATERHYDAKIAEMEFAGRNPEAYAAMKRGKARRRVGAVALAAAVAAGTVAGVNYETGKVGGAIKGAIHSIIHGISANNKPGMAAQAEAAIGKVSFPEVIPLVQATGNTSTSTVALQERVLGHNVPGTRQSSTVKINEDLVASLKRAGLGLEPESTPTGEGLKVIADPNQLTLTTANTILVSQSDSAGVAARSAGVLMGSNEGSLATTAQYVANQTLEAECGPVLNEGLTAGVKNTVRYIFRTAADALPGDKMLGQLATNPIDVVWQRTQITPKDPLVTYNNPSLPIPATVTSQGLAESWGINAKAISVDVAQGCAVQAETFHDIDALNGR